MCPDNSSSKAISHSDRILRVLYASQDLTRRTRKVSVLLKRKIVASGKEKQIPSGARNLLLVAALPRRASRANLLSKACDL